MYVWLILYILTYDYFTMTKWYYYLIILLSYYQLLFTFLCLTPFEAFNLGRGIYGLK